MFPALQPLGAGKSKSHLSASKLEEIDPHNPTRLCRNLHGHEKSLSKEIWFLFLEDYSCPAHSFLLGYLNSALVLCILCKDFWGRGGRAALCPVDRSVEGQAGGSAWAEVPTRPRILQGVDASPMAWGKMLKGVLSFQAKPPYSGNQKSREQAFHRR